MTIVCPCCNQPMNVGRAPIEGLTSAPLTRIERRIVEALTSAYPRAMNSDAVVEAMYWDDPEGGPEDMSGVLKVMMWRLRQKLPAYGWTIPSSRGGSGNYGVYKLEPLT